MTTLYRITFDDSATKLKTRPNEVSLSDDQLHLIMQSLPSPQQGDLQVVGIESATLSPDFDMDDSRKWMANLSVTLVIDTDEVTANLLRPYELLPGNLPAIKQLLRRVSELPEMPNLKYSGDWVLTEIEIAQDFTKEPPTPKV